MIATEKMQQEIIKKNIKEFTLWITEEKEILVGKYNSMGSINWKKVDSINDFNDYESKFILNDEYVEFRKAIVEGKQILFMENNDWIPIENSFEFKNSNNEKEITKNYKFDSLYMNIGLYKIGEKK